MRDWEENFEDQEEGKSRSQVKREMTALQKLGARLMALPEARLKGLGLSEDLLTAVLLARRITDNEGKRRQVQYIGRLMRETETEAIEALFKELDDGSAAENARFQRLESWRDRLVEGDEQVLDEIRAEIEAVDAQHVRNLARNAAREASKGKPPKSSRALFRYLREQYEALPTLPQEGEGGDADEEP